MTLYPEVSPDFGHWLAGFIDGEGCFHIGRKHQQGGKYGPVGPTYTCRFRIGLRSDDALILHEIAAHTGIGAVGYLSNAAGNGASWTVYRKVECMRLVELLDQYPLRAKKMMDYAIWKQAVIFWSGVSRGQKGVDWSSVTTLRERLTEGRRFTGAT